MGVVPTGSRMAAFAGARTALALYPHARGRRVRATFLSSFGGHFRLSDGGEGEQRVSPPCRRPAKGNEHKGDRRVGNHLEIPHTGPDRRGTSGPGGGRGCPWA